MRAGDTRNGGDNTLFKGESPKLNGHMFQCANETTDKKQFARTTEELIRWTQTDFEPNESDDIRTMLRTMKEAVFILPTDPTATASRTEERIWESQCSDYIKGQKRYKGQKGTLFATIWGQCSPAMQASLRSAKGYEEIEDQSDVIELLNEIRGIIYNFDSRTYVYESILKAKLAVFAIRQEPKESAHDYLLRFQETIAVSEYYGASLFGDEILVKQELVDSHAMQDSNRPLPTTSNVLDDSRELAQNKMQGYIFIQGADRTRYLSLNRSLQNNYAKNNNQYPESLSSAFNLLTSYTVPCYDSTEHGRSNIPFIPPTYVEEDDSSTESNNSADEGVDTHSDDNYDDDDDCDDGNEDLSWPTRDEDSMHDQSMSSQIAALVLNANNYRSIRNPVDEASTGEDADYDVDEASTGEDADDETNEHEYYDTDDSAIGLNSSVNEGADSDNSAGDDSSIELNNTVDDSAAGDDSSIELNNTVDDSAGDDSSIELNNTVDDSTGDDSSIELNNTVNEGAEYNVDEENHQYWHREVNNTAIPVDAASTGEDSDDEVDAASTGEDADDEVDEASTGEESDDEVDEASTREDANDDDIDEASTGEDANDYESYEQENDNTDDSSIESNDSTEEGADSSIESNSSVDEGADSTDEIHEDFNWSGDSDNNSDDDEDDNAGTDPEVRPPDEASDHSHSPDQIKESLSHNYSLRSRSNLDKKHD